jgi:hypothetical protein
MKGNVYTFICVQVLNVWYKRSSTNQSSLQLMALNMLAVRMYIVT